MFYNNHLPYPLYNVCYIIFWGGFHHNTKKDTKEKKKVKHSHKMMQSGNILIKIRLQILQSHTVTSVLNLFYVAVVVAE